MSKSALPQGLQSRARIRLQEHYDRLWSATKGKIRAGDIEVDPILAAGRPDRRRGLTLVTLPSPNVRQRVAAFLERLREVEPDQYYYAPSEFHVTVLSLFTATIEYQRSKWSGWTESHRRLGLGTAAFCCWNHTRGKWCPQPDFHRQPGV